MVLGVASKVAKQTYLDAHARPPISPVQIIQSQFFAFLQNDQQTYQQQKNKSFCFLLKYISQPVRIFLILLKRRC